jgi:D-glycero-alpha-D-manno-heptose 1-phosphate guanylyltransferase
MAPVAGKPFIAHVIDYYKDQGIQSFILALGYKNEMITDYVSVAYSELSFRYSIEKELLGTGGAIRLACTMSQDQDLLVLNGDTIFKINLPALSRFHKEKSGDCTLSLKPMTNFDRYGLVEVDQDSKISNFQEKKFYQKGTINGGVYALNAKHFLQEPLPEKFSFEKDYLEKYYLNRKMYGLVQDEYFIDIGIPADYQQAQKDFSDKAL